jgi:FMN phosphatase YigB (HAD superfamily)
LLIIFDLDDTLIDTSGCVTPFKMKECLERLIALGVCVPDFSAAYGELLEKNRRFPKSKDAFVAFARGLFATDSQIEFAIHGLITPLPDSFRISMTPNAQEIIEFYAKRCPLAIVTGGHPPFQWDKLKKAGIDTSFFSMISIPEDSVKKPYYLALQEKFSLPSQKIWVCGDRIEMDLKPAFELGFRTIHMRWGRGASMNSEEWIDHSISNLSELKEIIK